MELLFPLPNGLDTISDVWQLLKFLFYLPGNLVISWIATKPQAAYFFEIDCDSGNGTTSLIISVLTWGIFYITYLSFRSDVEE